MNSLQGTPMYMSPEVIKNQPGGRLGAMDIWSVQPPDRPSPKSSLANFPPPMTHLGPSDVWFSSLQRVRSLGIPLRTSGRCELLSCSRVTEHR